MRWFAGAILLLLVALVLQLGLLAYAMYVLLGVMAVSRLLTRAGARTSPPCASATCSRPTSAPPSPCW